MKTSVSPSITRNWSGKLHKPLQKERSNGYDRRHFHQLFRQLRITTQASRRNIVRHDLGHCDNQLGNHRQIVRQLFHHLQHRNIETLDDLVPDACVPLQLPPRQRLKQCSWPLSPGGPAIVRRKLNILGRTHLGAGASLLFPQGGVRGAHLGVRMVGHRSQHRNHRLLLVSPPRAQTALPPPPWGSRCAVSHEPPARVRLERAPQKNGHA